LLVIAKEEYPKTLAVKYRYSESSPATLTGNCSHFLSLYLFRVIEAGSILLSCSQDFSTLKPISGFSMFFGVATPPFPTHTLKDL